MGFYKEYVIPKTNVRVTWWEIVSTFCDYATKKVSHRYYAWVDEATMNAGFDPAYNGILDLEVSPTNELAAQVLSVAETELMNCSIFTPEES